MARNFKTRAWSGVLEIISGKNQKHVIDENGKYPIYGSGGIIGYATDFLCEAGTTIIGRKGTINSPIFVNEQFWNVDTAFGLSPKEGLSPKYLYYFCRVFNFKELDKSTTIPSLAKRDLLNIQMPVPDRMEEQERIVNRIEELFSELDKAVETLQTIKQQLEVYKQAVYASAFSGIGELRPLIDFFDISGGVTKNSKRSTFSIKMPYLRVANVYYNRIDLDEIKEIGINESEIARYLLKKNDLLFVEGNGSKSQIGRIAMWDGSIKNCIHQNHIIKGRPVGNMSPMYALYYLISRDGRKQITDVAKSTSGLYTLSTNKIKELMVPYCDIPLQRKIVEEIDLQLSLVDKIETIIQETLVKAEALRKSILKQAFEGRLI